LHAVDEVGRDRPPGFLEAAEVRGLGELPHQGLIARFGEALHAGHKEQIDGDDVEDRGGKEHQVQPETRGAARCEPRGAGGYGEVARANHRAISWRRFQIRYGTMSVATRTSMTIATAAPLANWLSLKAVCHM